MLGKSRLGDAPNEDGERALLGDHHPMFLQKRDGALVSPCSCPAPFTKPCEGVTRMSSSLPDDARSCLVHVRALGGRHAFRKAWRGDGTRVFRDVPLAPAQRVEGADCWGWRETTLFA